MEEDTINKLFTGFIVFLIVVGIYWLFINKDPVGYDDYAGDPPSCDQFGC